MERLAVLLGLAGHPETIIRIVALVPELLTAPYTAVQARLEVRALGLIPEHSQRQ